MICLLYAHPYPDRSRANRVLLSAVSGLPGLEVRPLYDWYPDFAIDVEAEQRALIRAKVIVLQHPFYWYGVPGLLKHWFDKVLQLGWAYGTPTKALEGKTCLWVTTTGAPESGYAADGMHRRPFEEFVPAIEQTARFCGMQWAEPMVVFGAPRIEAAELEEMGLEYRRRLSELADRAGS
jgi:glutathione-regulated potassium-efflux system ancillary protein KefF